MDAAERPAKLRKLSHDHGVAPGESLCASDRLAESMQRERHHAASDAVDEDAKAITLPSIKTHNDADGIVVPAEKPAETETEVKPLSKNQLKRIRRKEEWEAKRDDRKAWRKEKTQERRERKKAARVAAIAEGQPLPKPKEYIARKQLPVTIIIDCDFDDLMHEGERTSLGSQVTRSYSDNKNARFRAHLTISSFGGHLRERFDGLMEGMYKSWRGVRFLETDFVDVSQQAKVWMTGDEGGELVGAFDKYTSDDVSIETLKSQGEVVYLSSEADDTLLELKPFSTYIIGGLVDKNREKGLCHKRATQRGIRTARLPIGDFLDMSSRRVLTTNHVNEIMLRWLEHKDWGRAFIEVIPQRKGGKLKTDVEARSVEEHDMMQNDGSHVIEQEAVVAKDEEEIEAKDETSATDDHA